MKYVKQPKRIIMLKSDDQMTYVCIMNNIRDRAREIVFSDVIY